MGLITENRFFLASAILGGLSFVVLLMILTSTFGLVTERRRMLAHVEVSRTTEQVDSQILKTTFFGLVAPLTNLFKTARVNKKKYDKQLKKLRDAGFKITPYELLSIKFALAFAVIILAMFVMVHNIGDILEASLLVIMPLFAFLIPDLYVMFKAKSKIKIINRDFVMAIKILSNSMQGGYSIPQAMRSVSKTLKGPMAHEFERMYKEIELGFSIEETLKSFSERVRIGQTKMLATIISINNTVGGNVVEAFQNAIESIEVSNRIYAKVRVATASARASLKIVGMIPIVLFVAVTFISGGEYFIVFTQSVLGWTMVVSAVFLQIIGIVLIRKMSRIDI